MYLYERMRHLREDNDKNQEQIASILGIKRQQYARYEKGLHEIPLHYIITLAKYYNVSLDYLTGLIDTPRNLY
ncbi:MAG: helix-turn-helix transcriptional regulator [Clostridia bacterium]|nr:helix-turn-helix transcriptional regulator [Clostridia bacterium]MBO5092050.1 helix-turn-helix transcriptional regulator [Clostridia bacterium]MBP3494634.1 helix-turn-helix transcriptional regulator [Clostridia bacterium]MBQ7788561.1 helix-turn-helix transcriptional regulator [Clostridia bacterium]